MKKAEIGHITRLYGIFLNYTERPRKYAPGSFYSPKILPGTSWIIIVKDLHKRTTNPKFKLTFF